MNRPRFCEKLPTAAALLMLGFCAGAGAQEPPPLSLEAIFEVPQSPGEQAPPQAPDWPTTPPGGGGLFVAPAAHELRRLLAPLPAPPPEEEDPGEIVLRPGEPEIPRLPPRGFGPNDEPQRRVRPLMVELGRDLGAENDQAAVALANETRALALRLTIEPEAGDPLVLLLSPSATDSFSLPEGDYATRREIWNPLQPDTVLEEEFPPQELRGGWMYEVVVSAGAERELQRQLDRSR